VSTVEVFATGHQIGTFTDVLSTGNSDSMQVTLIGVATLGAPTDVFRIVVRQVKATDDAFTNGHFVDIHAWPDADPPAPPLYAGLTPQHDRFDGRASSLGHQIFDDAYLLFDLNGITTDTVQYGPGPEPPRDEKLPFSSFASDAPSFPCYAAGTLIAAEGGPVPVEQLQPGNLVLTADNGLQPIRWIGARNVSGAGHLAPILIKAGALGNTRDLLVSPQHRMLMQDWRSAVYFGDEQVFVAAKHLLNGTTITRAPMAQITYVHLAFDRHEVIFAEGCPSESLHLAAEALTALDRETLAELHDIFPELAKDLQHTKTARGCLRAWEARMIAAPPAAAMNMAQRPTQTAQLR
jgi:hypothetical protein